MKLTQKWRFGYRKLIGKYSGDHYLWRREGIIIRQKKRLGFNVVPMEA